MVLPRLPKQVAEKARQFACQLYKNVPDALIPNAGNDALRFVWDNLCDPPSNPQDPPLPGHPPPPAAPINGGQCVCAVYRIRVTYTYNSSTTGTNIVTGNQTKDLFGPIGSLRVVSYPPSPDGSVPFDIDISCRGENGEPKGCTPAPVWRNMVSRLPNYRSASTANLGRVDGGQDNCGNPPKEYPPALPAPPDGFKSPPTQITLNDGDNINITFNLKPPTYSPPTVVFPPINVNVTTPDFNIPLSFEFNGDINFGAPAAPPMTLPPDVVNNINNINNNTNNINNTTNNINNTLEDFFDPTPFESDPDVTKEQDNVEGGKEEDKDGVMGVLVNLTKLPDKSQFGNPSVFFAGWLAFKRDEGYLPREALNFEQSFFLAPPGCTGYTVTLTNGAEAIVTVYSVQV